MESIMTDQVCKKINLPAPPLNKRWTYESSMKDIIRGYLEFFSEVNIAKTNIEVDYNDVYKFWDVSIFRYSQCSYGCGSFQYREELWKQTKRAMEEIFAPRTSQYTWRWPEHMKRIYGGIKVETENGQIPGMRYFIEASA